MVRKTGPNLFKKRCNEIIEREQRALTRAKREAEARGKERFDLARLNALYRPDIEFESWFVDPEQQRLEQFEYLYYVCHKQVMTLQEFARELQKIYES